MADDRRIAYRVGVNLGEIVVDDDDIYGDGVNVAARLEAIAEANGICVSSTVFDNVRGKIETGFEDLGEQQFKNISAPVRTYRVLTDPAAAGNVIGEAKHGRARWAWAGLAAVLIIVIVGGGIWWQAQAPDFEPADPAKMAHALPDKPSIAVLPFTNLGGDPEQEYFADGMAEDIITDLSKIPGLFVIARNSSFSYKGRQVKVALVAEELGVRYVLEGSVRRAGDQVRINAQLIDALSGGHLWAERYDGTLADVFALQDQVTARIVQALSLKLTDGEKTMLAQYQVLPPKGKPVRDTKPQRDAWHVIAEELRRTLEPLRENSAKSIGPPAS